MFNQNDKSLFIFRKIINVAIIVLMCACVIAGIVLIALAFGDRIIYVEYLASGIVTLFLGPIIMQLVWLALDLKFQAILDVKIIRNAQFGLAVPTLPTITIFKCCKKDSINYKEMSTYDILKKYRELVDAEIISQAEFDEIKKGLLNKEVSNNSQVETTIDKIKKLKTYADDKVITPEEFAEEKAKILKK